MKQVFLHILAGAAIASAAAAASAQSAAEPCGSLRNHYGPFDYRVAHYTQKAIVEDAHFTSGVETLTAQKTGPFGGDIAYTLHVFPNHPRALLAMERLVAKEKRNPAQDARRTIECYYERAIRFQPDDAVVRMLYVNFLIGRNDLAEARKHLDYVAESTQDNPLTQFNAGMLYFDMKDYDKALAQAYRAQALGMERPELRGRLQSVGRWVEPPPTAASMPAAASSAASAADAAASAPAAAASR